MSACFAYGLPAGIRSKPSTVAPAPRLSGRASGAGVVLLGGFTTNFIWTVYLNIRNRTGHEYLASELPVRVLRNPGGPQPIEETALTAPTASVLTHTATTDLPRPFAFRCSGITLLCALAGVTWYMQFFFYSMGETKMGVYNFRVGPCTWQASLSSVPCGESA